MKRKILIGTLLVGTMLTATFGFASCGEEEHTHTPVKTEAVSATCTTDGNKEYYTCLGCDKVYTDEACTTETTVETQKIPATGHTPNADDNDCTTAIACADCEVETTAARPAHTDDNADGICDVCTSEIDHIYDETTNTYTVYTADGLYAWAESASYGDINTGLVLAKDIVMPTEMHFDLDGDGTNESNWKPLVFNGMIDGNGHSITGVTVVKLDSMCGFLISLEENGVVKNLSLTDVNIEGHAVGGIVNQNNGVITNCNVDGTIQGTDSVGGIVMTNNGTITACRNSANITGSAMVGGIVVQMTENSKMIGCYNVGTIISTYEDYGPCVGGIVGAFFGGNVTACYSTAEVSATGEDANVGGVVGYFDGENAMLLANYWNTTGETPTKGNGRKDNDENALKVDGDTITWEAALTEMNAALESAESEWRYALNTGDDAATRPLILVKEIAE